MTDLATRNPRGFGLLVTFVGVSFFFPDALVVRLIDADAMTVAVWRGLAGAFTTLAFVAVFLPSAWPGFRALISGPALAMMVLQGFGSIFFLASLQYTSVANCLLVLATAPFLAAIFSWFFLHETIDRATGITILVVFAGVAVIAIGSLGGGTLFGDMLSFLNAVTIAAYYVILRKARSQNLIVAIACGYLVTSLIALPFAPFEPLSADQWGLIGLSGGVILAGGVGLLQIGPRYLPAPEVSLITMLEIVMGPLLVWWILGENPGTVTLWGGGVIITAILVHAIWQLGPARRVAR